ncbi:MAG: MscL family protein [Patescibacteria group bacterium]
MAKRKRNDPTITQVVSAGSTIRFETPKSARHPKPKVTQIVTQEVTQPVNGFMDFLREYTVVSVAVAFVIGLQAQTLIKQLVSSFIDPLFKLIFGQALSLRTFTLEFNGRTAVFDWGAFAYGLLNFLFVLAAIYALISILNLDKLDKPKNKKDK